MSAHISIAPEKPTLSKSLMTSDCWYLRLDPDVLVVMTEEQADELATLLWNRSIQTKEAA